MGKMQGRSGGSLYLPLESDKQIQSIQNMEPCL